MEDQREFRPRHATTPIPYNSRMGTHAQHNTQPSYSTSQPAFTTQVAMDELRQSMPSYYAQGPSHAITQPAIDHLNISRNEVFAANDPRLHNENMMPIYNTPPPQPPLPQDTTTNTRAARGRGRGGRCRRSSSATVGPNPYGTPTSSTHLPHSQYPPTIDLETSQGDGVQQPCETAFIDDDSDDGDTSGGGRGPNFTKDEDLALCSAWLYVSTDPVVGHNQTADCFWDRIVEHFHLSPAFVAFRPKNSLQHRWGDLAQQTNKFCGHWATVQRINPSGKTEQDKIDQAMALFRINKKGNKNNKGKKETLGPEYKFLHCWKVLRNERKWMDYVGTMNAKAKPKDAAGADGTPDKTPTSGADGTPETRPMGRDAAKKRRSAEAQSSTASAYIECMQEIKECKRQQQQTEATWAVEYKTREDRKLAIEEMKVQDALQAREDARRAREDALRAREDEIMRMSLSSMDLTPVQRKYWENEQNRIFIKREQEMAASAQVQNAGQLHD